ncbi:MAG: protein sphX, partial [Pseudomonadota bacterium]|nr:protein sphX [Pseudomonadota bacterium]
ENQKKLNAVAIDNGKGKPVLPSAEAVENGTYVPLSRPIFIYVSEKSLAKPEIKEFVQYYLLNAPKLVAEVQYVPLPQAAYKTAMQHLEQKKFGTVFGGEADVGVKIDELLKREAKL